MKFPIRHLGKFKYHNRATITICLGVHITCHSFRHAYAKEEYDHRIAVGMTEKEARYEVSELIGHSRDDITRIYLVE